MDCSEADTMLDELALDVLPGDQRAALLAHLQECAGCRQLLDELSETADDLLLAGPEVAPPVGFEDRVLSHVRGGRRSRVRRPVLAAAAVAAALLVVGGIGGAMIGRSTAHTESAAAGIHTVRLISTGGTDIGDVSTLAGPSPWFFMRVEGALADGTYRCVLDMADGTTVDVGRLWALNGHGGWGEHLSVDLRQARAARLLDRQGTTLATAHLG
jgi:Putative zinc-finger